MEQPYWLDIALAEAGTKEVRGGENPRILEYFRSTAYHASEDEVPWCAAFTSWVLDQAQLSNPSTVRARDFESYGTKLDEPRRGCIAVFWRGSQTSGAGHVGFVLDVVGDEIVLLGGNQSDQVKASLYSMKQLLGFRWPCRIG